MLGSGLIAWPIARPARVELRTLLPRMMFVSSGNLGISLLVLAFGDQTMPAAVVLFLIENFLHFSLGVRMLDRNAHVLRVLLIPVTLACVGRMVVNPAGLTLPCGLGTAVEMVGQVAVPIMLVSLGVRLTDVDLSDRHVGLLGALSRSLSGVLLGGLLGWAFNLSSEQARILVLFGALPPAVLNYIFAERYG